jgi:hypothetical protein
VNAGEFFIRRHELFLEEILILRYVCRFLPVLALMPFCIPSASAQSAVDVGVGFGGAWASANSSGIDNANSVSNAYGNCTPGAGDVNCQSLPKLNSFFMSVSGDVMFKPKFGFGADASFMPARSDYGPLSYRQSFYDFDGIFRPIETNRAALDIHAGIGMARTGFSVTQTSCVGTAVCSSQTGSVGTASHFQTHIGVGVPLFVTKHFYVKPEFDVHYVNNFTDQFGRNWVPQAMVTVGYSLNAK